MPDELVVGDPLWWLYRLEALLTERRKTTDTYFDYYTGNHPVPDAPAQAVDTYRRLQQMARTNLVGLVVDAEAERLKVEGFRLGGEDGDEEAWRLWQANNMDADSQLVHTESLIAGESYVSVWGNPDDPATPIISAESPSQVIVAYYPGTRKRAAALKVWTDDWYNVQCATVYLPDGLFKYQHTKVGDILPDPTVLIPIPSGLRDTGRWERRNVPGEEWPVANPYEVVPIVPFRNKPRLLTGGTCEFADVVDIQDRINETVFNRLMAAQFGAFRQKWVTGMDIPIDPTTGDPVEPFKVAVDRLFMSENPDAKFGEFGESSLEGYIKSVEDDVQVMAARTRTPPHYLLGEMVNLAAEALKAAEAGLVAKVRSQMVHFGESWETVERIAFTISGDDARANVTDAETIWRNPEFRSEGQLVDALTKMATLGVPRPALWEKWGASPQEIDRWKGMASEQAATDGLAGLSDLFRPPVSQGATNNGSA